MRRHAAGGLLFLLLSQSCTGQVAPERGARNTAMPHYVRPATPGEPEADVSTSRLAIMHFRAGKRAVVQYPDAPPLRPTRDPRAVASAKRIGSRYPRRSPQALAVSDEGAGINRWWTYEERPIPGIGKAMLNVGTGNLLIQATDVDIPERGLDLVIQRTYNNQSLHDANGEDGAEPAIFGNGWTNTYDAHIVVRSGGQTISVYDIDGTRCDYAAQTNGSWKPCTGEHAILEVDPQSEGCSYWWIKKSGTAYWFHSSAAGCNEQPATVGHVYKIVGRNSNNSVTLHYSFVPGQPHTSHNVTAIEVDHSDGQRLTLTFGLAGTSGPNELASLTRPDGKKITYAYNALGDLLEVDRPGNDAAAILPETYGVKSPIHFACGPRATISKQSSGGGTATDGACLHFDYDSNRHLIDWKLTGVVNFNPQDGFGFLQPDEPKGWRTWYTANFVYGGGGDTPCAQTANDTTTMCDVDGHSTVWTLDPAASVTQTQSSTGPSSSLTTTQRWDDERNLIGTTDARGNETDYGYDARGNTVEVVQPSITSSIGRLRPTSLYSYDRYNNIVSYCDPVSNAGKIAPRKMAGALCPTVVGFGNFVYRYRHLAVELYGELVDIYTPCFNGGCRDGGNHILITYAEASQGGTANYGLPTSVTATSYTQADGTTRRPQEDFTYNASGNLRTYVTGQHQRQGGAGTWTLTYDAEHMNRVVARRDPDGYTTQMCYNADGSTRYTQTPYQSFLDGHGACVPAGQTPPPYAVAFAHDTDGDVTAETHHHGGKYSASFPQPTSTPDLRDTQGTRKKYYDGDDRLVEVVQPADGRHDLYTNPWITRYFYDITQGNGEHNLTFQGKPERFAGYGNLYKTLELLPSATDGVITWGHVPTSPVTSPEPAPTPIVNGVFADLNATAFDALDRPTAKYTIADSGPAEKLVTEALTYDANEITLGQLSSDCMSDVGECKVFRYDSIGHTTSNSFTLNGNTNANTPNRTTTYDPDGRIQHIAQAAPGRDSETYAYDLDGRLLSATNPEGSVTYAYYHDGKRKSLGGSKLGNETFAYSYAPDGALQQLNYSFLSNAHWGKLVYDLTAAGRVARREDYANGSGPMTTERSYAHALLTDVVFPCGNCDGKPPGSHASMMYSAEGELLGQLVTAPWSFQSGHEGQHTVSKYAQTWYYNHRGELVAKFDHNGQTDTRYANGVQVVTYPVPSPPPATFEGAQATWDARMGAVLSSAYASQTGDAQQNFTLTGQNTHVAYDRIGRNVSSGYENFCATQNPEGCGGLPPLQEKTTRSYDIENHVTSSSASYYPGSALATRYQWGANGHPKQVGSTPTGGQLANDLAFWDGDVLLYSMRLGSIDDIKIGTDGEYTPSDPGYNGVTFYDRGVDGSVAFCHNATGGSGGLGDGDASLTHNKYWTGGPSQPCGPTTEQSWGMRYARQIAWSASYSGSPPDAGVGHGWTIGELRSDGINDGVNTIQGARAFDPTAGQWTTPDAYAGTVHDPMTQKAYMWDDNNPVLYADPGGYSVLPIEDPLMMAMVQYMAANSPTFAYILSYLNNDIGTDYAFRFNAEFHYGGRFGGNILTVSGPVKVIQVGSAFPIAANIGELAHEIGHMFDYAVGRVTHTLHLGSSETYASAIHNSVMSELAANGYDASKIGPIIQAEAVRLQGQQDMLLNGMINADSGMFGTTQNVERFESEIGAL